MGACSAEDVRLAVEFAAGQGLPAGVLAAGHGPGAAVMDGGVLVSTPPDG